MVRVALTGLVLAAFATGGGKGSTTRDSRSATLLTTDRAASDSSARYGLAAALVWFGAEDLVYLHPGAPLLIGREAAHRVLAIQPAGRLQWTPLHAEVSPDGSFGVSYGVTAWSDAAADSAVRFGRYLSAWRQQGEEWRLVAHAQIGAALPPSSGTPGDGVVAARDSRLATRNSLFASADRRFAEDAARGGGGAPAAFAAWAAPDAVIFGGGGELIRGPEAIRASLGGGPHAEWKWAPVISGGSDDGALGFTVGTATITRPGPDGGARYSKYLTLWRRGSGGELRFLADGGNARPPDR